MLHGTARTVFVETPSGATRSQPASVAGSNGPPSSGGPPRGGVPATPVDGDAAAGWAAVLEPEVCEKAADDAKRANAAATKIIRIGSLLWIIEIKNLGCGRFQHARKAQQGSPAPPDLLASWRRHSWLSIIGRYRRSKISSRPGLFTPSSRARTGRLCLFMSGINRKPHLLTQSVSMQPHHFARSGVGSPRCQGGDVRKAISVGGLFHLRKRAAERLMACSSTHLRNISKQMLIPLDVAHDSGMISPTVPI